MMKIIRTLTWIEFKTYFRNRTALFWTFANPLATMVVLMLVFGGQQRGITLPVDMFVARTAAVADQAATREIINDLRARTYLTLAVVDAKPDKRGAVGVRLTAPNGRPVLQHLYGEPSHFELVRTAVEAAQLRRTGAAGAAAAPVAIQRLPDERGQGSYGIYLTVGILSLTVLSVCLFGFSVPLVEMRASGAGRMYQLFPMDPGSYMIAYILSRIGVIVLLGLLIVIFADVVYDLGFPISSPLFLLDILLISLFAAVSFISLGLVIASFVRNVATATAVVNIVYLPLTLFSDIFLPLSLFPEEIAKPLGYLPVAQFVNGARAVIIEGTPFWLQWPAFLSLAVLALVCLLIARLKFSWQP